MPLHGTKGVGATNLLGPRGMAQDENGNVYVVDSGNGRITFINRERVWLKNIAERGEGNQNLLKPIDVAYDGAGRRIFVLDNASKSIQIYNPEGEYLGRISDPALRDPRKLYLTLDRNNEPRFLYVLDREQLLRYHLEENSFTVILYAETVLTIPPPRQSLRHSLSGKINTFISGMLFAKKSKFCSGGKNLC